MGDEYGRIPEMSNSNPWYLLLVNNSNINGFHVDQPSKLQIRETPKIKIIFFFSVCNVDIVYYIGYLVDQSIISTWLYSPNGN